MMRRPRVMSSQAHRWLTRLGTSACASVIAERWRRRATPVRSLPTLDLRRPPRRLAAASRWSFAIGIQHEHRHHLQRLVTQVGGAVQVRPPAIAIAPPTLAAPSGRRLPPAGARTAAPLASHTISRVETVGRSVARDTRRQERRWTPSIALPSTAVAFPPVVSERARYARRAGTPAVAASSTPPRPSPIVRTMTTKMPALVPVGGRVTPSTASLPPSSRATTRRPRPTRRVVSVAPPPIRPDMMTVVRAGAERRVFERTVAIDRSVSVAHRHTRVERQSPPVTASAVKPDAPATQRPWSAPPPMTMAMAARPWTSATPPAAVETNFAEVERVLAARIEQRLDQKISATIKARLGSDAELSRTLTSRVYDGLYDRMILEKERRG